MDRPLAKINWNGDSLNRICHFPDTARQDAGFQLGRVQQGLEPRDWRPMTVVGPGVVEIRIHVGIEYRVLYVALHGYSVHVLHAFLKKTQRTKIADIELARTRYRELGKS